MPQLLLGQVLREKFREKAKELENIDSLKLCAGPEKDLQKIVAIGAKFINVLNYCSPDGIEPNQQECLNEITECSELLS